MNSTAQPQPPARRHRPGWFDLALLAYAGVLFYWVFRYDVRESYWFGIFCCGPMLVIVCYVWVRVRRRRQTASADGKEND
jgi:hypothetical protein